MRRSAAWAVVALCLAATACGAQPAAPSGPLKQAPDGRKLVQTFGDEFDAFHPLGGPGGVWRTTFGDGHVDDIDQRTIRHNGELQLYVDPRLGIDPFAVHGGTLEITAARAPSADPRLGGYGYTSGLITSQPSFAQQYGYFEMRAALPRGKGLWPAFWLLAADGHWPPEIDVMESIGDPSKVYVTVHSAVGKAQGIEAHVPPQGFHTFAVAWDAMSVIWYVDGAEVGRQPTPPDMHKPMYMLANLAIGGGWAGAPDATTTLPVSFKIDYIRAYRFAP